MNIRILLLGAAVALITSGCNQFNIQSAGASPTVPPEAVEPPGTPDVSTPGTGISPDITPTGPRNPESPIPPASTGKPESELRTTAPNPPATNQSSTPYMLRPAIPE